MAESETTLIDFNSRGYGEFSRLILAYGGLIYKYYNIPFLTEEQKKEMNFPVLEKDEETITQILATTRYLARQFQLTGADEWESAKCDEIVDATKDYFLKWQPLFAEEVADATEVQSIKKMVIEIDTPYFLTKLVKIREENNKTGSNWLVGSQITWADIYIAYFFPHYEMAFDVKLTTGFPTVEKLIDSVLNVPAIKEWLCSRTYKLKLTYSK